MKFDEIVGIIGEFGRIQKLVFLIICIPCISGGIVMTLSVILLGVPEHRCKIQGIDNDTFAPPEGSHHSQLLSAFIPLAEDDDWMYDRCHTYSSFYDDGNEITYSEAGAHQFSTNHTIFHNKSLIECKEWVYDKTDFKETFVSEHNLVCGDHFKRSTAQSLFFGGVLVGAFIFGTMSDVIGRKKTLCLSLVFLFASSLSVAWASSYIFYVVLRFFNGMSFSGTFLTSYVLGVEIVGPSMRKYTGIINEIFFALGECLLAGIGYWVKDWHYVQIIVSAPMGLFLFYWWLIPESPRWLINNKRFDEAEVLLRKAAKFNNKELPKELFSKDTVEEKPAKENLLQHMTTKTLFLRTMIIFYNWFVVSIMYYGLTLNSGNLAGNVYLNFFISGAVEFPAYIIAILFIDRLGRKKLHSMCMMLGGVACLSSIFTVLYGGKDLQWLTTTLSMVGKLGASGGFAIIYVFSAELFPTTVRNAGIGVSSAAARVGGMIAPLIAASGEKIGGDMGKAFPLIIIGAIALLAGILTLFLPETLNTQMPENIEDAKLFGTSAYQKREVELAVITGEPLLDGPTKTKS